MADEREINLARLGGLIDGEGTISVTTHNRHEPGSGKLYPVKMSYIAISNTEHSMPTEFADFFAAGHITEARPRGNGKLYRPVYRWKAVGKNAAAIIEQLLPYLVQKRPQALAVLEFQATQTQSRAPGVQARKHARQATLVERIREMNRRGVGAELVKGRR